MINLKFMFLMEIVSNILTTCRGHALKSQPNFMSVYTPSSPCFLSHAISLPPTFSTHISQKQVGETHTHTQENNFEDFITK